MSRTNRNCLAVCATALLACVGGGGAAQVSKTDKLMVYAGTYTGPVSKGIYAFPLDLKTGKAGEAQLVAETVSPSFLAIHPSRRFLYAANEISEFQGAKAGSISAFAIDAATGSLTLINTESSVGPGPCHITVDRTGRVLLLANYGGGSIAAMRIGRHGRLGKASAFVQHTGSGPNPRRQEAPHAHSINISPDNRHALAADLGLDKVLVYRLDTAKGALTPAGSGSVAPGAGPRHLAFHPSGKFAFVINEMNSTLTAFSYDAKTAELAEINTLSTTPGAVPGNSTAEVVVHPSGKWVYGSNRGHDSIALFAIDGETGRLTAAGHQPTGGKTPRNFAIDPTGAYLLAANQNSNTVTIFRIDPATGGLTPTGQTVSVPTPVCLRFLDLSSSP